MIQTKAELKAYIKQDEIMNGVSHYSVLSRLRYLIYPNVILTYLRTLRKTEYYHYKCPNSLYHKFIYYYYQLRLKKMGLKLGYSIPINVFGPGLSLPHYGTIIVNSKTLVGANCRLHACVNIGASAGHPEAPVLGDNVYLGPGAILFGNIHIADNVTIGANATVNKDCLQKNVVLAGSPAKVVKENYPSWVEFNNVKC